MILELTNGRELKLPDAMSDEAAKQLGSLILALEAHATQTEERVVQAEKRAMALVEERVAQAEERAATLAEERIAKAEERVAQAEKRIVQAEERAAAALAAKPKARSAEHMPQAAVDLAPLIAAISQLRVDTVAGFARVVQAQRADRRLMPDDFGEMTRVRVEL